MGENLNTEKCIVLTEDLKNYAYSAITHENLGGELAPPSIFVRNDE